MGRTPARNAAPKPQGAAVSEEQVKMMQDILEVFREQKDDQ